MKRFTATEKWLDPWFTELSVPAKILWFYLLDNCDNAGVIRFNAKVASVQIGQTIEEHHFAELGDRVQALCGGKIWIPAFIPFQYGKLSPECRPHIPVMDLVVKHGLNIRLPIPFGKGVHASQEKDPVQEKDQVQGNGGKGEGGFSETPSWEEFWAYCQTQSCLLPAEWYARDKWEAANQSNWREKSNWKAYARRCKGWWESDGRPTAPPTSRNSANGKPLTPLDYKTIIQAKETQAAAIKNRFCSETACDRVWADESKRQEYATLRKEIKDLTAKLGAYAT